MPNPKDGEVNVASITINMMRERSRWAVMRMGEF